MVVYSYTQHESSHALYLAISYRYYIGQKPHILVTDLDMLKQILVKDFNNFVDREVCAVRKHFLTTSTSNIVSI